MANDIERMHILQMIEDGKINAEEGLRLLNALSPKPQIASAGEAATTTAAPAAGGGATVPPTPELGPYRDWWLKIMWVGVAVTILGSLLLYWVLRVAGVSFWLALASPPFVLGVVIMALAWASRTAKWIHIRIKTDDRSEGPRRILISLPLPIGPAAWLLRVISPHIPKLRDTGVDELILALSETTSPDAPLIVDVNEGEGGERVQVYIG